MATLHTIEVARKEIAKIYIAAFNRVPDAGGLSNWMNQYMAELMTYEQIAADFANQPEYTAKYPSIMTDSEYITQIYLNVFGRNPDEGGKQNWINQIANPAVSGITRGSVMQEMLKSASVDGNSDGVRLANQAKFAVQSILDGVPTATATAQLANITADDATVTAATAAVSGEAGAVLGQTISLTTGVDTKVGGANNDTFNAVVDGTDNTFTVLDSIDGSGGNDTLNIVNAAAAPLAMPASVSVVNVETVNLRSADDIGVVGGAEFDVSGFTGLVTLNTTQSVDVAVKAAATTNVNVSGATGPIEVIGGQNVSVTDATASKNIIVSNGAATGNAAGTITVTDSAQGTGTVVIDGGTTVSLTTAVSNAAAGAITVGANKAATGAVTVTQNVTAADTSAAADADFTLGNIAVTGGTSITVDVNVTATDGIDDTDTVTATIGGISVTGSTATTAVTVSQTPAQTAADAVTGVTAVAQVNKVVFGTLASNDAIKIGGLTLTNTTGATMTAAEVAAAFANLAATSTQGCSTKGEYSGSWIGDWSSSAVVTTATETYVTFTGPSTPFADGTASDLYVDTDGTVSGDDDTDSTLSTDGVTAVTASAGKSGIVNGAVTILDNATAASITTITVEGYGASSRIGGANDTTVLSSLALKNSGAVDMTVDDTAATLALAVESLGTSTDTVEATVTFTAAPTTLNVTATGNNYIDLVAAATTTLSVAGTGLLNIADDAQVDLTALTTVTVSGSASLVLAPETSASVTSINSSATTGAVTATIDGAVATYTGGAGVDTVTLATSTALTKAIDLGAGNDTLSFAALLVTGSTATLSGGDGTDTLSMSVAEADALDASTQTFYTNFERLTLNTAAGDTDGTLDTVTIDLEKLALTSYVTSNGTNAGGTPGTNDDILAITNMASGGTLAIVAASHANVKHTVSVKDAGVAGHTTDSLNVVLSSTGALTAGTVTAANVETINITATDTDTTAHSDTMTLTAAAATAVTVAGNASLTLTMTGSTAVTSINASTMTGGLTVTSLNTTAATTITGGAGADVLTAATGTTADVLIGGAGNDTLTGNAGLSTLTGGEGKDSFVINVASLNSSSYATITDIQQGETIEFTGADSFQAARVTLADTAVFQDYVNAAMNSLDTTTSGDDMLAWFQYLGNTYIVMDEKTTDSTSFVNGEDMVVKISGLVDLSTASFNSGGFIQVC